MFFNMRKDQMLLVGGLAAGSVATSFHPSDGISYLGKSSPNTTCNFLKQSYPNMTILPTDSGYTAENEVSWNAGNWLGPACVLTPANGEQMACAIKTLTKLATPFAMRGGGHMPNPTAANINSTGVLISSSKMSTMELSEDGETLSVGTGPRWGDVYIYLNQTQTGKMVVGGRYAPVGIPGLLLGGGMSFFSYEYGFASSNGNVRSYECVLADGSLIDVTEDNEYADLYWALRGGGNSFCIVTKFGLRTFDSPSIALAMPNYGSGEQIKDAWLDSILNYVLNGSSDPKAAIIPLANYANGLPAPIYGATLFYNGGSNDTNPAIFSDFQGGALPASNTTNLNPLTMAGFSELVAPAFQAGGQSNGLHQTFHVMPHVATKEAMTIVHDTFFAAVDAANLTSLDGFIVGLAWNSITSKFIEASNTGIGCPQGVVEEPAFWVEEALSWANADDTPTIQAFITSVNANMTSQLEAINATTPYIYLNDADESQDVFAGYPKENVERLKSIRAKYDPRMIYTNLMPGGFKVAKAA